jgi:hypothetical protein
MPENRLFRLTWNTSGWEHPIGHDWKPQNQGNGNIAYEHQYGFGHEEWLFNPRLIQDGYQYGYIRGSRNIRAAATFIDTAYLFTIDSITKIRYLVGEVKNLHLTLRKPEQLKRGTDLFTHHLAEMMQELEEVEADTAPLETGDYGPTVHFRPEDCRIYDTLIPAPGLAGQKYNRFKPYEIEGNLAAILARILPSNNFTFIPGIASTTERMERTTSAHSRAVKRQHSKITNDLAAYFAPEYSRAQGNISVEKTKFGENIADVVLQHSPNEYPILEAKTSANQRRNVREAVGQLLDYALWHDHIRIREIIAVAPTNLDPMERAQFVRIQEKLSLPLHFWKYDETAPNVKDRFIKIL